MTSVSVTFGAVAPIQQAEKPAPQPRKSVKKTGDPNKPPRARKGKKNKVWTKIKGFYNAAKTTTDNTTKVLGSVVTLINALILVGSSWGTMHHAVAALLQH